MIHADGSVRTVLWNAATLFTAAGAVIATIAQGQDITDWKRAEAALRESERRMTDIFDFLPDATLAIDRHGIVIAWNRAIEAMTGVTKAEMIGKGGYAYAKPFYGEVRPVLVDLVLRDQREIAEKYSHVKRQGDQLYIEVFAPALYNGKGGYIWATATPLYDCKGDILGAIESIRDITAQKKESQELMQAYEELKKTQQQLVHSEKLAMMGTLAAGVAHEINNPISFISTNLHILADYIEKLAAYDQAVAAECVPEEKKGRVDELAAQYTIPALFQDIPSLIGGTSEGVERIKKIVQDLRLFSRPDTGKFEKINITECIESTLSIIYNEIKYKAQLVKEYGEIPLVVGNSRQLSQVFMNILINGAQSIDKYGAITIRTLTREGTVVVEITDTGSGIPEEKIPNIFQPFFSTKPEGKGTGLGLSIVQGIVEKHKGTIEVISAVGKGTMFRVVLPAADAGGQ